MDIVENFNEAHLLNLHAITSSADIDLRDLQFTQLKQYANIVIDASKQFNLISPKDRERFAERHLFESLLLTKGANFSGTLKMADIGSGAGLPAIPLKIWNPELEVVMFESTLKKCKLLESIINEIGLKGIKAVHMRGEEAARLKEYKGTFNRVTARAVSSLKNLLIWTKPFIKTGNRGGLCVFPKGSRAHEELNEINRSIWVCKLNNLTNLLPKEDRAEREFNVITASPAFIKGKK